MENQKIQNKINQKKKYFKMDKLDMINLLNINFI